MIMYAGGQDTNSCANIVSTRSDLYTETNVELAAPKTYRPLFVGKRLKRSTYPHISVLGELVTAV